VGALNSFTFMGFYYLERGKEGERREKETLRE